MKKQNTKRGIIFHGWVFHDDSGKLIDFKIDFDKLLEDVITIYRLKW